MVFVLRIDIDTEKGLKDGVTPLLSLLSDHQATASFYIPMGGSSSIFELIKHRKPGQPTKTRLSPISALSSILFPRKIPRIHQNTLQSIIDAGHDLGPHGWKHREWTNSLDQLDLQTVFEKIETEFQSLFNSKPATFSAPGFLTNTHVWQTLQSCSYSAASDLPGNQPLCPESPSGKPYSVMNVPITLRVNTDPFIDHWHKRSDRHLLELMKQHIIEHEKKFHFSSLYLHALYEPTQRLSLLKNLFSFLSEQNIPIISVKEAASMAKNKPS